MEGNANTIRISDAAPASPPVDGEGGWKGRGREKEEREEAEEGEEGDVDEEGCRLGLDDETDDIQDFIEEDTHGVDLYQKLERLEYEALVQKKRKALHEQDSRSGETTKKPRREEEDENRERILEGASTSGLENRVVEMVEDEGREGGREVEEEEELEEEEEGDEGEEEEGYRLQFDGEMDPLDFIQEDANGVELYQQFERLEYEALAERKRKAHHEQQSW